MTETKAIQWSILLIGWRIVGALNSIREHLRGSEGWSTAYGFLSTTSLTTVLYMLVYAGGG